jgi:peptide/nickel transport system permease protein
MRSYLVRRLLAIVPTLLAVSVVIFLLLHSAPGGPMAVYANNPNVDPADLARLEASLGLHDPYPVQYVKWLGAMVTGNWGISYKYARPVGGILGDRLLATLQLVLASLVLASAVAIPVGVLAATTRPALQRLIGSITMLGVSVPTFWLGIVVLLVFSVKLRVLPSGGMATIGAGFDLADRLWHVAGPAAVLATLEIAGWSRYLRSMLLEAMGQDYIRTARAKGLSEAGVVLRHGLRNALARDGTAARRVARRARLPRAHGFLHADGRARPRRQSPRRSQLRGGRPPHQARLTWRIPASTWKARGPLQRGHRWDGRWPSGAAAGASGPGSGTIPSPPRAPPSWCWSRWPRCSRRRWRPMTRPRSSTGRWRRPGARRCSAPTT